MGPREVVEHVFPGITESGDFVFIHRTDYDEGRFMTWVLGRMGAGSRVVKCWSSAIMDTQAPCGGSRIYIPDTNHDDEEAAVRDCMEQVDEIRREDVGR